MQTTVGVFGKKSLYPVLNFFEIVDFTLTDYVVFLVSKPTVTQTFSIMWGCKLHTEDQPTAYVYTVYTHVYMCL